jgi:hypothetical protein
MLIAVVQNAAMQTIDQYRSLVRLAASSIALDVWQWVREFDSGVRAR